MVISLYDSFVESRSLSVQPQKLNFFYKCNNSEELSKYSNVMQIRQKKNGARMEIMNRRLPIDLLFNDFS